MKKTQSKKPQSKAAPKKDLKSFTIDRSRWLRGSTKHLASNSALLDPKIEAMCCLGFHALACGLTKKQICDVVDPSKLPKYEREKLPLWLFSDSHYKISDEAQRLMVTNDHPSTDAERETVIKTIFEGHGITVRFVGEGRPHGIQYEK